VLAGTNEADLQLALATIRKLRGGVCAVRGGKVLASVALPIAGLLSDERAPVVAKQTTALKRAWSKLGCKVPYMGFNLLPLSVIPALRLTDKGLIDVVNMRVVPLFEQTSRSR
jgi:adenine deaminase